MAESAEHKFLSDEFMSVIKRLSQLDYVVIWKVIDGDLISHA